MGRFVLVAVITKQQAILSKQSPLAMTAQAGHCKLALRAQAARSMPKYWAYRAILGLYV
jgi:hypothetical protein